MTLRTIELPSDPQRKVRSFLSGLARELRRFAVEDAGFAAAESALLALLLIGICIVVGSTLQRAAIQAATSLNEELAGN
jgi:Flp pilus assembly pilin Flp